MEDLIEASNTSSLSLSSNKMKRTLPSDAATTSATNSGDLDRRNNGTVKQMPPDWKTRLRRVLFQSVKENPPGDSRDRTRLKSKALWEKIYKAPLQVIDAATRREIPTDGALIPLESMSDPNERISGVMVSTEKGIELRTSEGLQDATPLEVEESRLDPTAGLCNCHLIYHGDTLLAYWSVGFSGNNLEYLVYPLPHNVPTPPIFETFHPDPILRPSPIDLNPLIMSRSNIDEVPFQASLEFGLTEPASSHYAHAPLPPPPKPTISGFQYSFPPMGSVGASFPYFGFPPNPNFIGHAQEQGFLVPNFGFGRYPPPTHGQELLWQPPIGPLRKQAEEDWLQNPPLPPPRFQVGGTGPLDPFNPNHPKSIQEILFHGNVGGFPGGLTGVRPPFRSEDGPLPHGPGPSSGIGIYPPEYDQYPRHPEYPSPNPGQNYQPPRDQVVRTRPPGIYVDELGGRRPEDQLTNYPRQPGNYNYNDRGISDRPTYQKYRGEKEDCYKNDCFDRYGADRLKDRRIGLKSGGHPNYQSTSTNSNNKVRDRDGRKLVKDKAKATTESGYVLNF